MTPQQQRALYFRLDAVNDALAKLDYLLRANPEVVPDTKALNVMDSAENYIRLIRETEKRRSAA